ncbi:hypothetical protein ACSBR2_011947 [Camellia fascicularis]
MDKSLKIALFSCLLISVFASAYAQTCASYSFSSNRQYTKCNDLPYLNSYLHWNYHPTNGTVDIAFRHTNVDTSTWVAWALNINGSKMAGSQALVALHNTSGLPHAYTSSVSDYSTKLAPSNLSFNVPSLSVEYISSDMLIYATLVLPSNGTTFNQLWQAGPVSGGNPDPHPTTGNNILSTGTLDFLSGTSSSNSGGVASQMRKKNTHGILNAISWGILLPVGAIIARYLKTFKSADPAWFYLHVTCQSAAYIVGVAGWATGLKLGSDSVGIQHNTHRNIGITLFCLGTLQVFALLLRPKKDHKYRLYWNIYHWGVGYAVIVLSIMNIFEGFDILNPGKSWKRAYIGIIIALGSIACILEAFTWFVVLSRKKKNGSDPKYPHVGNGENEVNGYGGTRSQQVV